MDNEPMAVRDMQRPKFNKARYAEKFKKRADEHRAKGRADFSEWYKKLDRFHQTILIAESVDEEKENEKT